MTDDVKEAVAKLTGFVRNAHPDHGDVSAFLLKPHIALVLSALKAAERPQPVPGEDAATGAASPSLAAAILRANLSGPGPWTFDEAGAAVLAQAARVVLAHTPAGFDYSKTHVIEPRGPVTHELKTWTVPFRAVEEGLKGFEFRRDDRDFREGDTLWLRETEPGGEGYTGRELCRRITYCLRGGMFGVPLGYVVMSLTQPEPSSAAGALDALSRVSPPGRSIQSLVGLRPEGLSPSREDRQQLRTGDAP